MKKKVFYLVALSFVALLISGCLSVEKKEYTFEFTDGEAGTLTIKYINIFSAKDDSLDVSEDDFNELVDKYLNGDEIEKDYPNATNIKKRIFLENGVLCGEVKMDFASLGDVKLYKYDKKSPYMLSLKGFLDSETYDSSNGKYGGEDMPVVFWDRKSKTLNLTTTVSDVNEDYVSMVGRYNAWKK